jgi:hypothetical protein
LHAARSAPAPLLQLSKAVKQASAAACASAALLFASVSACAWSDVVEPVVVAAPELHAATAATDMIPAIVGQNERVI